MLRYLITYDSPYPLPRVVCDSPDSYHLGYLDIMPKHEAFSEVPTCNVTLPLSTTSLPLPPLSLNTKMVEMSSHPFDAHDADVVLRSGGLRPVDFRVYKNILASCSPLWASLFHFPQASITLDDGTLLKIGIEETKDGHIPVITMPEKAAVIYCLLRFLYPGSNPPFSALDDLTGVLEAAFKYKMLSSLPCLRRTLLSPSFLQPMPLCVYAIAVRYGLREEAEEASRCTLKINITDARLCDDLNSITGSYLQSLIQLHHQRRQDVLGLLNGAWGPSHCSDPRCTLWIQRFREKARPVVDERPDGSDVFDLRFLLDIGAQMCEGPNCPTIIGLAHLQQHILALKDTI